MRVVVSDTSPIRALHHIGFLNVLGVLFDEVIIAPTVARELERVGLKIPDSSGVPAWIAIHSPADVQRVAAIRAVLSK